MVTNITDHKSATSAAAYSPSTWLEIEK